MTMPIASPWSLSMYPDADPTYRERQTRLGPVGAVYYDELKHAWITWHVYDETMTIQHRTEEDAKRAIDQTLSDIGIYLL